MRIRLLTVLVVLGLIPATLATADDVVLKGGSTLTGVVLTPTGSPEPRAPVRLLLPGGDEVELAAADVARVERDPDAPAPGAYVRYKTPTKERGGGLEVAVITFVTAEGPRVDLVAAVHIADGAYYREVQKLLEAADVVLYEAVKPRDTTADEMQKSETDPESNPIRAMQEVLAKWLHLEFQLDAIEYGRPHFVHADLTAEEFVMETSGSPSGDDPDVEDPDEDPVMQPGEDEADPVSPTAGLGGLSAGADLMRRMIEKAMETGQADIRMWRSFLGRMLGSVDAAKMLGSVVPNLTDVLIDKRNAVVIERVREWAPKTETSIAVFYGAAHMPDIERLLVEELGYRRAGGRWLRAWDIK